MFALGPIRPLDRLNRPGFSVHSPKHDLLKGFPGPSVSIFVPPERGTATVPAAKSTALTS